jgi:hypothetical protein
LGARLSELQTIADLRFGSGSPATWFPALGLITSIPNPDGTGFVEPSGGGYARPGITNNTTNFPAATIDGNRVIKVNGAAFSWGDPTADWGAAGYVGFFTASTGGTPRWVFEIDGQITIRSAATIVEIPAGDLILPFPVPSG